MNIQVHYKHDMKAPKTSCGLRDPFVIWTNIRDEVTCDRCNDNMDMRAP